jgi:flagellar protein FlaG
MNSVDGIRSTGQTAPVSPTVLPAERLPEHRELIRAIKALNAAEYFDRNNELTFLLDRETRRPVVRIVDRTTNEVIRQIPPEYVLRLAEDFKRDGEKDGNSGR